MNTARTTPSRKTNTLMRSGIHFIYTRCIEPKSVSEDDRRHEFILNIILLGSVILVGLLDLAILIVSIHKGAAYEGTSFGTFSILLGIFAALLAISRTGHFMKATYMLLALYYASATYCIITWGVELPLAGFAYALTIVISSILVSTRFGFLMTGQIALTLIVVGYSQIYGHTPVNLAWRLTPIGIEDPIELSILLFLIMTISWLSNREIEKSLIRARRSERLLAEERDSLEIKVEERTKELKNMQHERLTELYRFAEFGKLSSGIFHDLMNPLNALIANMSQADTHLAGGAESKHYILKAVDASRRMGELLGTIRRQIRTPESMSRFSLGAEISEAMTILNYRIKRSSVVLHTDMGEDVTTYGNSIKFHQVALNLIANAIDACEEKKNPDAVVHVTLGHAGDEAIFSIVDNGLGMDAETEKKIFTPFFTTKSAALGLGLGLSTTKDIIEKDFHGTITVRSEPGIGSTFTVTIPLINAEQKNSA
jgi:signal transduction histidine kinase